MSEPREVQKVIRDVLRAHAKAVSSDDGSRAICEGCKATIPPNSGALSGMDWHRSEVMFEAIREYDAANQGPPKGVLYWPTDPSYPCPTCGHSPVPRVVQSEPPTVGYVQTCACFHTREVPLNPACPIHGKPAVEVAAREWSPPEPRNRDRREPRAGDFRSS